MRIHKIEEIYIDICRLYSIEEPQTFINFKLCTEHDVEYSFGIPMSEIWDLWRKDE